jgi:molybdate transport system substrate-binding protein
MKVLSALAVKEVVGPASREFGAETGEDFDSFYGPVGTLTGKIAAGETADLLIAIPPALEKLTKEGVVTGRYDLGAVGIWVTIRPGLKAPDLSTPESFKQMLLDAKSVSLTDPGVGGTAGIYLADLLKKMGVADAIASKVQWQKNGFETARVVSSGQADLGMTQKSEIVAMKDAILAGPLPAPIQAITTYSAAVFTASKQQDKARAFIDRLVSPALHARWKAAGFDLPARA